MSQSDKRTLDGDEPIKSEPTPETSDPINNQQRTRAPRVLEWLAVGTALSYGMGFLALAVYASQRGYPGITLAPYRVIAPGTVILFPVLAALLIRAFLTQIGVFQRVSDADWISDPKATGASWIGQWVFSVTAGYFLWFEWLTRLTASKPSWILLPLATVGITFFSIAALMAVHRTTKAQPTCDSERPANSTFAMRHPLGFAAIVVHVVLLGIIPVSTGFIAVADIDPSIGGARPECGYLFMDPGNVSPTVSRILFNNQTTEGVSSTRGLWLHTFDPSAIHVTLPDDSVFEGRVFTLSRDAVQGVLWPNDRFHSCT